MGAFNSFPKNNATCKEVILKMKEWLSLPNLERISKV
jgi:hypothetical protein